MDILGTIVAPSRPAAVPGRAAGADQGGSTPAAGSGRTLVHGLVLDPLLPWPEALTVAERARLGAWLPTMVLARIADLGRCLRDDEAPVLSVGDDHVHLEPLRLGGVHLATRVVVTDHLDVEVAPLAIDERDRRVKQLAASLLPDLVAELRGLRRHVADEGSLQAQLERTDLELTRATIRHGAIDLGPRPHLVGTVAVSSGTACFAARVDGPAATEALATLVGAALRRWLTDLPDPDPTTVIQSAHCDVVEVLRGCDAQAHVAVVVDRGDGSVAVSSTGLPVLIVGSDGSVRTATVTGERLGARTVSSRLTLHLAVDPGERLVLLAGEVRTARPGTRSVSELGGITRVLRAGVPADDEALAERVLGAVGPSLHRAAVVVHTIAPSGESAAHAPGGHRLAGAGSANLDQLAVGAHATEQGGAP